MPSFLKTVSEECFNLPTPMAETTGRNVETSDCNLNSAGTHTKNKHKKTIFKMDFKDIATVAHNESKLFCVSL